MIHLCDVEALVDFDAQREQDARNDREKTAMAILVTGMCCLVVTSGSIGAIGLLAGSVAICCAVPSFCFIGCGTICGFGGGSAILASGTTSASTRRVSMLGSAALAAACLASALAVATVVVMIIEVGRDRTFGIAEFGEEGAWPVAFVAAGVGAVALLLALLRWWTITNEQYHRRQARV